MTAPPTLLRPPAPPHRDISEAAFQRMVVALAQWLGYRVYHTRDSRGSEPGFPDLTIVGHGRLLFWELKTRTGRVSAAQEAWGAELVRAGLHWRVVRPVDWDDVVTLLAETAEEGEERWR